ncbi:MAG: hypothetical protein WDO24_09230 [Pseudomonadota bacterium]
MPRSCRSTAAARWPTARSPVLTGEDVKRLSDPFLVALKQPLDQWSLAVERVRYVGEPVALVVAVDRYAAEDALEHIQSSIASCRSWSMPRTRCGPTRRWSIRPRAPTWSRRATSPMAIRPARSRLPSIGSG